MQSRSGSRETGCNATTLEAETTEGEEWRDGALFTATGLAG